MTRNVTFYHRETGELHALTIVASDEAAIALNTPSPDHVAIDHPEGRNYDHLSQRIDIASGTAVDYQPPQPSVDHEWDAAKRRWRLSGAAAERRQAVAHARRRKTALGHEAVLALLQHIANDSPDTLRVIKSLADEASQLEKVIKGAEPSADTMALEGPNAHMPVVLNSIGGTGD